MIVIEIEEIFLKEDDNQKLASNLAYIKAYIIVKQIDKLQLCNEEKNQVYDSFFSLLSDDD